MIPVKGTQIACQVFKENTLSSPQSICECWVFAVMADCHLDLSGEYTYKCAAHEYFVQHLNWQDSAEAIVGGPLR